MTLSCSASLIVGLMGAALMTIAPTTIAIEAKAMPGGKNGSTCYGSVFDNSKFIICPYDPHLQQLSLHLNDSKGIPLRSFGQLKQQLGKTAKSAVFAMNAGMYDIDGNPTGLYIENSRKLYKLNTRSGRGNFYLQPNGVFFIKQNGDAGILSTSQFVAENVQPQWATQSGPMLVIKGKRAPAIQADGPSRYVRNGVCSMPNGQAYFVISQSEVSFGKLARMMSESLKCSDGLYLDGFVSSLWEPATGRMDDAHALGPMLVVSTK